MSVGHYGDRQCTTKKECSMNEAYVKRQDQCMIDICGRFPAKRDTLTHKVPASPLETKVGSTAGVKFYVIVS